MIDGTDDTYYYSCSQNAGCSGVHDVALDHDDALGGGGRGSDEREGRERHRPRRRQHDHDRLDRRESGDGHDDGRRNAGCGRHGRHVHAGARVRARIGRDRREERRRPARRASASARGAAACGARPTRRSSRIRRRRRRCTSAATTSRGRRTAVRAGRRSRRRTCSPGPAPADDSAANNPLYAGQFPSISTIAPSKSDPNTIYVGTDNGRLWRTTDLGVLVAGVPESVRARPAALGDVGDRRSGGLRRTPTRRTAASARATRRRTSTRPGRRRRQRHVEERERQPAECARQLPRLRPAERHALRGHRPRRLLHGRGQRALEDASATTCRTRRPRI